MENDRKEGKKWFIFPRFLFIFNSVVSLDWFTTKKVEFFRLKRKTKIFLELEKIECIDELIR